MRTQGMLLSVEGGIMWCSDRIILRLHWLQTARPHSDSMIFSSLAHQCMPSH